MRTVHVLNNKVTEIVPEYAIPVLDWYGPEFASHCIEAPDQVQPNWKYNPVTGTFYEPTDEEELTLESLKAENKLLKSQLQAQVDRSDFIEDCIAEMAMAVYGEV